MPHNPTHWTSAFSAQRTNFKREKGHWPPSSRYELSDNKTEVTPRRDKISSNSSKLNVKRKHILMMTHHSFNFPRMKHFSPLRPKRFHHQTSEGHRLSEMAALNVQWPRLLLRMQTDQSAGAQHGTQLRRFDLLTGVAENVMDLASPSISINTLTEDG